MEGADVEEFVDKNFIEDPAILAKHRAAAEVVDGK
jgi:hypothetical protein